MFNIEVLYPEDILKTNKKANSQYFEIYNDMKKKIRIGELTPGLQLYTEPESDRKDRASRPMVKRTLLALDKETLLVRFKGTGTILTYPIEVTKPKTTHSSIAMIVPRLDDPFIGQILTGIQEVLEKKKGFALTVKATNDKTEKERDIIDSLLECWISGPIAHSTSAKMYNPVIITFIDKNIPFVMTERYYKFIKTSFVEMDNCKGANNVVKHPYDKGHRHIGLVSKPALTKTSEKIMILGFFEASKDLGLPISLQNEILNFEDKRSLYLNEQTLYEKELIHDRLYAYLQQTEKFTAIVANNDLIGVYIMQILEEIGKNHCGKISLVGFDNVIFYTQLKYPLSSVEQIMIQSELTIRGATTNVT